MFDEFKEKLQENADKVNKVINEIHEVNKRIIEFEKLLIDNKVSGTFEYPLNFDASELLYYDTTKRSNGRPILRLMYYYEGQNGCIDKPLYETGLEMRQACISHLKPFMKKIVDSL